jgi:hypothetical protein
VRRLVGALCESGDKSPHSKKFLWTIETVGFISLGILVAFIRGHDFGRVHGAG